MKELILSFDTDTPEFSRGFEAGMIWASLRADRRIQTHIMHSFNAEMAIRMAEASGRTAISVPYNKKLKVTFSREDYDGYTT